MTYNFDFNVTVYQAKKYNLIKNNYPEEIIEANTEEIEDNPILSSDKAKINIIEEEYSRIKALIFSCDKVLKYIFFFIEIIIFDFSFIFLFVI